MPKSAMGIMKEYAEKPYTLWELRGQQFTIVEDLPKTKTIREKTEKSQKGKDYQAYFIKVQSGLFEKDLRMLESELTKLFLAMPTSLTNFRGAILTVDQGVNKDLTYIGLSSSEMNENFPSNANKPSEPAQPIKTINDYADMLAEAVKTNTSVGITTTYPILQNMADKIYPGRALDVIMAAKAKGCLSEHGAEGYRGH